MDNKNHHEKLKKYDHIKPSKRSLSKNKNNNKQLVKPTITITSPKAT
jgi:hypothetical protein